MSLVIIGSVAFDTIETPAGKRERIIGGSGTYAALAASLFTRPGLVSVVGRDFPRSMLKALKAKGVDLAGLRKKAGKTFHWHGVYSQDTNIRVTLKTEMNVLADYRPVLPESFRNADILFLSNLDPDIHPFILQQMKKKPLLAMDTIRYWIENKPGALMEAIQSVNILFVNDEECRMIAGEFNLVRAGRNLKNSGPELIIVKKGEHGALVFGKNFVFSVVAHPCETVVDPTGAGDSFAGAFLGYLDSRGRLSQREIRRAAVYGNLVASLVIEDFGLNRLLEVSQLDLIERYKNFKKIVYF